MVGDWRPSWPLFADTKTTTPVEKNKKTQVSSSGQKELNAIVAGVIIDQSDYGIVSPGRSKL